MKKPFDEETVVQTQAEREYMIKDNLPNIEGLTFYENYAIYPVVLYKTSTGEELTEIFTYNLSKNGFDSKKVEIGFDQSNSEIEFTFDLEWFDETDMKHFFKIVEKTLAQERSLFTDGERSKLKEIQEHFKEIEKLFISLSVETREKILGYHDDTRNLHHSYYQGIKATEELLNQK